MEGGRNSFLYILFPFQSYYMESTCTAVYVSLNKCTYAGGKYLLNSFRGWATKRNIKISCRSRLFFVLHLLVKSVIVMAIARKAVKHIFILIQFFSYLGKQRLIVYYWCVKVDSPMGALNGLFDFWTPWNCQKIISFLMVLGGGGA